MTQSQIVLKILEEANDWVVSYELSKVSTKWGWVGPTGDRRARELAENGVIERKHDKGYAWYRKTPINDYKPSQTPMSSVSQPQLL